MKYWPELLSSIPIHEQDRSLGLLIHSPLRSGIHGHKCDGILIPSKRDKWKEFTDGEAGDLLSLLYTIEFSMPPDGEMNVKLNILASGTRHYFKINVLPDLPGLSPSLPAEKRMKAFIMAVYQELIRAIDNKIDLAISGDLTLEDTTDMMTIMLVRYLLFDNLSSFVTSSSNDTPLSLDGYLSMNRKLHREMDEFKIQMANKAEKDFFSAVEKGV